MLVSGAALRFVGRARARGGQGYIPPTLASFFITYSRKLVKRFLGVPGTRTGALQMVRDPIGFAARYAPGDPFFKPTLY